MYLSYLEYHRAVSLDPYCFNDVVYQLSPGSSMSLFADDMALYRRIYSVEDYQVLQQDISAIVWWINNHLLSLQTTKCCYMILSRKRSPNLPPLSLAIENTPLTRVSSVKYLGLQITCDLSWSPHVTNVCNKTRRLIGLLYRRFYRHTDSTTLLHLFKTFIRPHQKYCSIVWDPHLAGDI